MRVLSGYVWGKITTKFEHHMTVECEGVRCQVARADVRQDGEGYRILVGASITHVFPGSCSPTRFGEDVQVPTALIARILGSQKAA